MDKENNLGLLRLDYCSPSKLHTNPQEATDLVPKDIAKFAGLEIWGSHVHFPVPGDKELAWAIPLVELTGFPESFDGNQSHLPSIINCFAQFINVSTSIVFESPVL